MKNILAIDDDKPILKFISEALNSEYNVFTAEPVSEAEDILNDNDINIIMPQKNSLDMIMKPKKPIQK